MNDDLQFTREYKMHTREYKHTTFVFNSDLSGVVLIIDGQTGERITVRGEDLLAFVGDHVRNCKISVLEQETPLEILGLGKR